GKMLTVRATAKRASFNDRTFDSAPYGPVALQTWETTPTPTILDDGTPSNGETLSVSTGSWAPRPASHPYQSKSDGAVISGATSATYTIKSADVGLPVTVEVSGVKTGFPPAPRTSQPVTPEGLKQVGAQPTITGTAAVDQKLTGGPGAKDWVPAYAKLTYRWYAEQTLIQSGTSSTLRLTAATVGKRITLGITSTKTGYDPLTRYSSSTARVARGTLTAGTVRIYGSAAVGGTLRASAGLWQPSPVVFAYRWKIGKKLVASAAGRRPTLTLPRSARGKKVTLLVSGSKAGYGTLSRSAVSSAVRP
ncbi:MAG: hypothetical protein Q7T71_05755, partial [Herbiconiux sp.]|nr:hypothetical protein [Herbiconiux sp.]